MMAVYGFASRPDNVALPPDPAKQFDIAFLGSVELDPEIRKSGDSGSPSVLEGESSPHAKSLFAFARSVVTRVEELKASSSESVIQIQ
jgi:ATP-binding protein involved in chromosome partitioning